MLLVSRFVYYSELKASVSLNVFKTKSSKSAHLKAETRSSLAHLLKNNGNNHVIITMVDFFCLIFC